MASHSDSSNDPSLRPRTFAIRGQQFDAPILPPALYLVATPIGNLGDMTLRGLETLTAVDLILCEDTRTSAKLLDHFGIRSPRSALHEHNERARVDEIVQKILDGQSIALISDAGTPLLSDPGFPLVRAMNEAGAQVIAIPGASALLAGLTISGLPTDRFTFAGFLPSKSSARKAALEPYATSTETLVFYESPRRLSATLTDMAEVLGNRDARIALELTKRYERSFSGTISELAAQMASEPQKGEAIIIVAGAETKQTIADDDWMAALKEVMTDMPLRQAVDEITASYGLKRKQVYDAALALKK